MNRLTETYIATLRKAVQGEGISRETILASYRKVMDYLHTAPSGEKAIPSEHWWNSELGQLLARARIVADGDLLTIAEFAKESGKPISTVSGWVRLGKLESIVDPDHFGRSPTGGFQRLIPRSELGKLEKVNPQQGFPHSKEIAQD